MRFLLGTHRPHWLADSEIPLFISRRGLKDRKSFPQAQQMWSLDSGAFTEIAKYGKWQLTASRYAWEVKRYQYEIGMLDWCAPMDMMCEPSMIKRSGMSVRHHQAWTVRNFLELRQLLGSLVIPVIQGWTLDEYKRNAEQYERAGVNLEAERVVGVGSICRRGQDAKIKRILWELRAFNVHGFGVRSSALAYCSDILTSADSMAWSYAGRLTTTPCPDGKRSCANCRHYAEAWYWQTLALLDPQRLAVA